MFSMNFVCNVNIKSMILRSFAQKYDFLHPGLMNARLSVHWSLKQAVDRIKSSGTLAARLSMQPDHSIFEKLPLRSRMSSDAFLCKLL